MDAPLTHPFHTVSKLLGDDVSVVTLAAGTPVTDALRLLLGKQFSQAPVEGQGGEILGVFSLRSLAALLEQEPSLRTADLSVEDALETLPTLTVADSIEALAQQLERSEAVLIGTRRGLQAIVTEADLVRYYDAVAKPFLLLGEIELGLRLVVRELTTPEEIADCIDRMIAPRYGDASERVPADLEGLSLEELKAVIASRDMWSKFEGPLGRNRAVVNARLERVRQVRNDVFHFRESDPFLIESLAATRDWLNGAIRRLGEQGSTA